MAKHSERRALSPTQLRIMDVVWERGEVSIAEIWHELCSHRKVARNTVQTTVARLEEKGWLKHRVQGTGFIYRAAAGRDATMKRILQQLVDSAFSGSVEGLVMTLLDGQSLSKDEAARIRQLIQQSVEDE